MIERPLTKLLKILVPQYNNSVNLIAYLTILSEVQEEIHIALEDSKTERYLVNAAGAQLDVIGIIVGLERGAANTLVNNFFGFEGVLGGGTFGTEGNPSTGELFRSEITELYSKVTLDDDSYRGHLEGKILINFKGLTIETIIRFIENVFGITEVEVTEGIKKFNLNFPTTLSTATKVLLTTPGFIPKPLGTIMTFSDDNGQFTG